MNARSRRLLARAVTTLVLVSAVVGQVVRDPVPGDQRGVLLAIQFAATPTAVDQLAPPGSDLRRAVLAAQARDPILIAAYWLLFASAALMFWGAGTGSDRTAAIIVFGGASLGAIFDILENRAIAALLTSPRSGPVGSAEVFAATKWFLVFVAALGMALPLLTRTFKRHECHLLATTGGLFLAAGALVGALPPVTATRLSLGMVAVSIGLLVVALLFIWEPDYVCAETLRRNGKDADPTANEKGNEKASAPVPDEADYLVDVARKVLQRVRSYTEGMPAGEGSDLEAVVHDCEQGYDERSTRRRQQHARTACRLSGQAGDEWVTRLVTGDRAADPAAEWAAALKRSDGTATAIIADVLARRPDRIPGILKEIGEPAYCPQYLATLMDTVVELSQPRYRAPSGHWLARHLAPVFTGREYLALLRDRHETIARALSDTNSWKKLTDPAMTVPPKAPERPATGEASMGMLGTQTVFDGTSTMLGSAKRVAARVIGYQETSQRTWQDVVACLSASEPSGDASSQTVPSKQQFLEELRIELLTRPDLVLRLVEVSGAAAPFSLVLAAELKELHASRHHRHVTDLAASEGHAPAAASRMGLFGIAFSGGGIRSATFNLGVLQGLAGFGLLRRVDYLSTVSGGGYIGAWLAAWIKRVRIERANGEAVTGIEAIEELLANEPIARPDERPVRPVRFLREYSNYLAPKTGFFSADTWSLVAIWFRNTLLNQLVLIFALAGALLLPWLVWLPFSRAKVTTGFSGLLAHFPVAMTCSAVLLIAGAAVAGQQLRRFNLAPKKRAEVCQDMLGQLGVLLYVVAPVVASGWILSAVVFQARAQFSVPGFKEQVFLEVAVLFLICHSIVAVGGQYLKCFLDQGVSGRPRFLTRTLQRLWGVFIISVAGVLASVVGAGLVVLVGSFAGSFASSPHMLMSWHWVVWGLPLMIAIMSMVIVLKIGILGRNLLDEHREWWSRVGAWLAIVNLSWIVLFGFAMYSAYVFALADTAIKKSIVASGGLGWALWTAAGVIFGKDSGGGRASAALGNSRTRGWIVDLAPYVFIVGLLGLVSTAAYWLVTGVSPLICTREIFDKPHWSGIGLVEHWLLAGPGLLLVAFLLSCRVDVNEFSMHHFYKNRLVRCYLGASREGSSDGALRSPDPFTGLDPADEVKLADLRVAPGECDPQLKKVVTEKPERRSPYVGPLPIVNVALNLVKGEDLAWQERKAQSFSFTPIFSGYEYRVPSRQQPSRLANQGFRSSFLYGYPPFGIGLGTAVAISGAAANPNMGYHSSPALGFLMTIFNARLGWWMGNPRDKFNWLRSTPRRGLLYLVNELLGLTSDDTQFVNLSDGGHFENLGVYELVRRRCRYIVACDAEQDGALSFNGLGNAIRKCRVDLGTEITIRATRLHPAGETAYSTVHTVIGDIRYPDGEVGTLVYLKASLTGDESTDVLEYKSRQRVFPHNSTGDQFFDESQFESYRKLGVHVANTTFAVAVAKDEELTANDRFERLRDYWYPPSAAIEGHFSDHVAQYDELLERVRKGPNLEIMDLAFFASGAPSASDRQRMFLGVALLDLMQRVFIDLDLEHDSEHPHNAGWMEIFSGWRKLDAVDLAWKASMHNYGRRFQWFVNNLPPPEPPSAAP